MVFEMNAIDHQPFRWSDLGSKVRDVAIEDAQAGPANEPVIQGLVRTIN